MEKRKILGGMAVSDNRILTIQDISCVGQCSLTVALPILSACGHETAVLPSAVLSTHTSGFTGFTFRDLAGDMPAICSHWKKENIRFAAIYTGYLGSAEQVDHVLHIAENCLAEQGLLFIDPAMADNGKLYPGFDQNYVDAMKRLCVAGHYVLPNLTEACLLTGREYREEYDRAYIFQLIDAMVELGFRNIILTGVSYEPGRIGIEVLENGKRAYFEHDRLSRCCHGTGDIYSSTFVGAMMSGKSAYEAAEIAAKYTMASILATVDDPDHWYGAKFEPVLGQLMEMLK